MRQDSAAKMKNCFCDGTEDFECDEIRENTDNLCYEKERSDVNVTLDNEEDVVQGSIGIVKQSSLLVVLFMLFSVLNTSLGESVRTFIENPDFMS